MHVLEVGVHTRDQLCSFLSAPVRRKVAALKKKADVNTFAEALYINNVTCTKLQLHALDAIALDRTHIHVYM